jgi:hypothetical protein
VQRLQQPCGCHKVCRKRCLGLRDDGKAIDPTVLAAGRHSRRLGLPGLRERAKLVGAELTVGSEHASGTEVDLRIPASLAYATAPLSERLFRKEDGRYDDEFKKDKCERDKARLVSADSNTIRIMTVDDHPLVRQGIASLVAVQQDMTLVGEASNGRDAIQQFRVHHPDITSWTYRCRR